MVMVMRIDGVPMKVPVVVRSMHMKIHHHFDGVRAKPETIPIGGEVMQRTASEPDHAVQSGEI
jgi:hypothetical protein